MTTRRGSCNPHLIIFFSGPLATPRADGAQEVSRSRTTSLRGVKRRRETLTPPSTGTQSKVEGAGRNSYTFKVAPSGTIPNSV